MQGAAYVSDALSTYQKEMLNKEQEMTDKYAETNGAGYHAEWIEWDTKLKDKLRKNANTAEYAAEFDQNVSKLSTSVLVSADSTEQKIFTKFHTTQLGEHTKDINNSIPLIRNNVLKTVETLSTSFMDKLRLNQTMGLLNATQIKEQENSGMGQFALSAGKNLAYQGNVAEVAMLIGGGERFFTQQAMVWMDKFYPADSEANLAKRAYITKKITTSGIKNKASFLEKYLTAEQKEQLIQETMRNLGVESDKDTNDLNEQLKEMNSRLSTMGIPTDANTVQQMGVLTQRIKDDPKLTEFQKQNRILGMHMSMSGGQMRKAFKQIPENDGYKLIDQFKAMDFSNPDGQKMAEAFMTDMGFTPEAKAMFMASPHLTATKMKEMGNILEREHRAFWNDINKDSGTKMYKTDERVQGPWDNVLGSFNLNGTTADTIINQQEFKKAVLITKNLENQLGIPPSKQTTIPLPVAQKIIGQMDAVFKAGDVSKIDVALDGLKGALSYETSFPGLFDNIESRLVEADDKDFFTTGTLFVMNLPSGPERVQLIENMTPMGQKNIDTLVDKSGFPKDDFVKKLETSGVWKGLESSLSTDLYGTNKVNKLKDALTDELIRRSLTDRKYLNRKEKAGSVDEIVDAKTLRGVVNDYINKTHTVYQTAGADMVVMNEIINRNINTWPEASKSLSTRPQFKEGLMLAAELTARDTALYDANFIVPPRFVEEAKAAAKAGRATVFGITLPAILNTNQNLDDPMVVKQLFLNSMVIRPDGSNGVKFTIGNVPILRKDGTPYSLKWDGLFQSQITQDYVIKGTQPKDYNVYTLFGLYGEKGTEKQRKKIKEQVGETIKKQEKLKNKQAQEELDAVNTEREENLDL